MRKSAIRLLVVAFPLYAAASAATLRDLPADDAAEQAKPNTVVPSNWSEPTVTVTEITIPPAAPGSPPAERVLSPNPLWAMPLKQFSVTRDRPIFLPSRRPPAPAVAVVEAPRIVAPPKPKEAERPELSLVGTIVSDDEQYGIFLDQTTKAVIRLKQGEEFRGWKLGSVQGRETSFEKNQTTVVVALPEPASQAAIAIRNEIAPVGSEMKYVPRGRPAAP